jgi:glycosyltransferase involved in cell wall biosynthesis
MTPTVSILMPVYNTAPYLQEAVDSMLAQTFGDFELIVLDDCSPDNAQEILDTYDDPRIVRYRGEHNQGLANVLNVGLGMARGKYIARMDSDDISLPDRLQRQVDYLECHPDVDLCSCAMELFGAREGLWRRDADPDKVRITALFFSPVLHASSLWRRESFERHGLRFDQQTVPAEDYDLWSRALVAGLRLVNLPNALYRYRIREGQATADSAKTSPKEREVRSRYFRAAFPKASAKMEADFLALPDLPRGRRACLFLRLVVQNLCHPFFHPKKLALRLWKYHRAR